MKYVCVSMPPPVAGGGTGCNAQVPLYPSMMLLPLFYIQTPIIILPSIPFQERHVSPPTQLDSLDARVGFII